MRTIDLRSDTITHPTEAMREAMYRAEVGDDGWDDDPTVHRLQELAAEMMGKEAGLLVPSGTMGNLVSILAQAGRGDEVILGDRSHAFGTELGGISALGGVSVWPLPNDEWGRLDLNQVAGAIRGADVMRHPRTTLLVLETTHNSCSGAVLPPEYMAAAADVAHSRGVRVHLDGARIFNAAAALGVPAAAIAVHADSVTFCLSKGLSCPIGSLICGSAEFITQARRTRRMVGGTMRQAGIIAAAGIVGLTEMVDRLADDHATARVLVEGLANIPGLRLNPEVMQSNIVIFEPVTFDPDELVLRLADEGVRVSRFPGRLVRMVTHRGVTLDDARDAVAITARLILAG